MTSKTWRGAAAASLAWMLAVAFAVVVPAANAADSFTAAVDPATAGTAEAPAPATVTLDLRMETDATGRPNSAVREYKGLLPAEFADAIAKFGTCDRKTIEANADGSDKPPPKCPEDSVLGSGILESVIPDLALSTTTDKLIIYNNGGGNIMMWFHVSRPTGFTGTAKGTISRSDAPFGPTVTWDFKAAADGDAGYKVFIKRLQTSYVPRGTTSTAAPSKPDSSPSSPSSSKKRKKKLAACERRAKKRFRRGSKRRARAVRACRKKYGKRRSSSARQARSFAMQESKVSPFQSTGCAGGKWGFQAQLDLKDKPPAKLDATVTCGGGTTPPPPGGDPPPCPLPICPPRQSLY